MSESSVKGVTYERHIAKLTSRALRLVVKRDPRSGAGDSHKTDVRAATVLPLFIEAKNRVTLSIKDWWRDANAKATANQYPVVVFPMEAEDLCVMRYSDVLQLIREAMDYREEVELLRTPDRMAEVKDFVESAAARKVSGSSTCKSGHIVPSGQLKCQWKGCQYSASYRKPKEAKR